MFCTCGSVVIGGKWAYNWSTFLLAVMVAGMSAMPLLNDHIESNAYAEACTCQCTVTMFAILFILVCFGSSPSSPPKCSTHHSRADRHAPKTRSDHTLNNCFAYLPLALQEPHEFGKIIVRRAVLCHRLLQSGH